VAVVREKLGWWGGGGLTIEIKRARHALNLLV
jgi:hypothetical protein